MGSAGDVTEFCKIGFVYLIFRIIVILIGSKYPNGVGLCSSFS